MSASVRRNRPTMQVEPELVKFWEVNMANDQEALRDNRERFHLWVFSTLHQLPGDELPRKRRIQRPDFRYQNGKLIIGIEHTEIKRTKSAQGKPSLAQLKGLHREIVKRLNGWQ